jgi:DNA-binding response OmpR family regulator
MITPFSFSSPLVLIVEDDAHIAELIQICLRADGYDFRRVSTGEAAVSVARRERPALVIMDIMMAGMDGYTAASILAGDEATREVPVIILTAKKELRDVFGMAANIVDFIEKPFDPEDLRARVRHALKGVRKL